MARPKSASTRSQLKAILPPEERSEIDNVVGTILIPADDDIAKIGPAAIANQNLEYDRWSKALFWTAYLLYPNIDITRSPYQQRDLKLHRPWGELLYYLLQVTRVCWEADPKFRSQFKDGTPIKVWGRALLEMYLVDIRRAWQPQAGKTAEKQLWTDLYGALQSGYGGYLDALNTPVLDAIFQSAQQMRKGKASRKRDRFYEAWTPFLTRIKEFIETIPQTVLATPSEDGQALLIKGRRGQSRRIKTEFDRACLGKMFAMPGIKIPVLLPDGRFKTYIFEIPPPWSENRVFARLDSS